MRDLHTHIYLAGILTRDGGIRRNWCSSFGAYPQYPGVGHSNSYISQAAKDVRASQDTLVDIFERIESFFRRLEVYTEVTPTTEMTDTIVQIMVEVLSILGIAMKEIKQGWLSEYFSTNVPPLTKQFLEKYGKRLIGKTDMEDALKKLDKLTQEEVGMAVAQNLRATHVVDERVREVATTVVAIDERVAGVDYRVSGIDDRVSGVDDRVARVDDRVAGVADKVASIDDRAAGIDGKVASIDGRVANVDDNVKGVDARVAGVDDRVKVVDEKVAELIHGAEITTSQAWETSNLNRSDGMEERQVLKQIADDVDQEKRSSSPDLISTDYRASRIISENQLRENIHRWLSPPDPSTNHNIACDTQHKKIATWFFQGSIFREWKSTGSLLWIHGKRAHCPTSHPISSDDILNCSWLWQEHSLVRGRLALSITRD
jgi:archaellum component FlaC